MSSQLSLEDTPPRAPYPGPPDPDRLLGWFGLDEFRPGQRAAVRAAIEGRDALVVMPTGGGKSLCYQLPGLGSSDLTLVISPLIALMVDQHERLAGAGQPVAMLASGREPEANERALADIRSGHARICLAAPERLASRAFRAALASRRVDLIAVDEAHCISEWGHDFRPDYLRLPRVVEELGRPPVMALTATATPTVAREIATRLGMRDPVSVRSGFDRPNISFDVLRFAGKGAVSRKLAHLVGGLRRDDCLPAIVYCGTRRDTESVAGHLVASGIGAVAYHAGMEPAVRAASQAAFMGGSAPVAVATSAFGMGVDKADIRSVWHWAIPTSVEAWYQEAGRAGRDGLPARAVLLAMRGDLGRLIAFNRERERGLADIEAFLVRLRAAADPDGRVSLGPAAGEASRIAVAICERAGAVDVAPGPGGSLSVRLTGRFDRGAAAAACRAGRDRGWEAYRQVERFASADHGCRRRMVLDHFGDEREARPEGRCCDLCDPEPWLEPAAEVASTPRPAGRGRRGPAARPAPPTDIPGPVMERLRAWRLERAGGKPAYTVATDAVLAEIARRRPAGDTELLQIHGVGPAFVRRHGAAVRDLLRDLDEPRAA